MEKIRSLINRIRMLPPYQKLGIGLIALLLFLIPFLIIKPVTVEKTTPDVSSQLSPHPFRQSGTPITIDNIQNSVIIDDIIPIKSVPTQFNTSIFPSISTSQEQIVTTTNQSKRVVVYGIKSKQYTQVREVDIDGSNDHLVAYLSGIIKDMHPISDHQLLYIANVDKYDHGTSIDVYDTKSGKTQSIILATPGFGIDDIVVSNDNRYIALWEVQFAPNQTVMIGGKSNLYLYDFQANEKVNIVEEEADSTTPIHYPLFFDKKNRLFVDSWIPNKRVQFFLGISYVAQDNPTQLVTVPQLRRGTFSSKPVLSPVDNRIAFSGYDPSAAIRLPATKGDLPVRDELNNQNQLVVMNLDDFSTTVISDKQNTKFYIDPKWSADGSSLIYTRYNPSFSPPSFEGVYTYNLTNRIVTKIENLAHESIRIVKYLGGDSFVYQKTSLKQGNLGETYHPDTDALYKHDNAVTSTITQIPDLQYVNNLTYVPLSEGNGRKAVLSALSTAEDAGALANIEKSLTFEEYEIDPLAFRPGQQNDEIEEPEDNSTKNPDATPTDEPSDDGDDGDDGDDEDGGCNGCACDWNCGDGYPDSPCWKDYLGSSCHDSPLYLYPLEKTAVYVKPILSGQIQYESPKLNGNYWKVIAYPDGELFTQENARIDKIEYSYTTSFFTPPTRGYVIPTKELSHLLPTYAARVGLNSKEANDFVSFWTTQLSNSPIPANYYFVSHFDKDTAKNIMDFHITPKPDTFIQVIMYFKPLSYPISVLPPVFEEIPERNGFVAVDWSGKIDLSVF